LVEAPSKQRPGVLLVTHPALFCQRDKHGTVLPEWSISMLRLAEQIWEVTLVLEHWRNVTSIRPKVQLRSKLFMLGLHDVEALMLEEFGPLEQVELAKQRIIEYGGKIRSVENPYDISIFNIDFFIDAPHFTCVGMEGHKKAGIRLDKPLNFKEIANKRALKTIW
jgi:hypothetical protein